MFARMGATLHLGVGDGGHMALVGSGAVMMALGRKLRGKRRECHLQIGDSLSELTMVDCPLWFDHGLCLRLKTRGRCRGTHAV